MIFFAELVVQLLDPIRIVLMVIPLMLLFKATPIFAMRAIFTAILCVIVAVVMAAILQSYGGGSGVSAIVSPVTNLVIALLFVWIRSLIIKRRGAPQL